MSKISVRAKWAVLSGALILSSTGARAQIRMETLGRGVIAVRTSSTQVYVGWRMLGTDPNSIGFNLYRSANGGAAIKVNGSSPITNSCNYTDAGATLSQINAYSVRPVLGGIEQAASAAYVLAANAPIQQFISVPLQIPPGGNIYGTNSYTYNANDCSVGDLDGDGEYEIVLKWDPTNAKDNSQSGFTGNVLLDAYKLDGTRLWRIDLGRNIRAGAHYTQFMVYDLDGDGRAEVACKTAPGTVDGRGTNVILGADNPGADYRNSAGYVLSGPEYLTIFDGLTGAELATTHYIVPRGTVSDWGDNYGNRVDRFLAGVAYLDGQNPSLIMCRGYYTRTVLVAWDWRNGQLTQRWRFDTRTDANPGSPAPGMANWEEMGNHQLSVADVDGDGKQEIVYGSIAVDDDGTGIYTTTLGHGDALHVSDMDPDRPGLEVFIPHESPSLYSPYGMEMHDAHTGAIICWATATNDVGRGVAIDLDPRYRGYEMWGATSPGSGLFNNKGVQISSSKPSSQNFAVWWDADLLRELEDANHIDKWDWNSSTTTRLLTATECSGNNGTKNTPCLSGDILGDWREEVMWRTSDNSALHIYTTTILATNRIYTLMHDPQYRVAIAWQNTAYNQPPHPGFYLGDGMAQPPPSPITGKNLVWRGDGVANGWDEATTSNWFDNVTAVTFRSGDVALLDDSGSNNVPVSLVGALLPGSVTVSATQNYTFSGSGSISGTGDLVKTNSGMLTINTTNGYTGRTVIGAGTVVVSQVANGGSASAMGAASSAVGNLIFSGGALRYTGSTAGTDRGATLNAGGGTIEVTAGASALTVGGSLAGSGALTKTGSGTLILSGASTFSGGVTNNVGGTLTLSNTTAAGSGVISLNGGTLSLNAGGAPAVYANAVNVVAASALTTLGSGNNNQSLSGAWSGNGALSINTGSGGTFSVQGNMGGFGGTILLTGNGTIRWYGSSGSSAAAFDLGSGTAIMQTRDGGTVNLGSLSGGAGTVLRGAGSSDATTTYLIGGNHANTTFAGTISNGTTALRPTAITKNGGGTLTLSGTNTHTGATTVSNGTLLVNGRLGNTALTAWGGTLGGNGSIAGAVSIRSGATLSPGTSIGRLTMSNNVTLFSGSVSLMEIGKSPTTNDVLKATGLLTLAGTLIVTNSSSNALVAGDSFKLFDAGSYGGTFASMNLPVLAMGLNWDTNGLGSNGTIRVVGPLNTNAPVLVAITDKTITEGRLLSFTNSANDTDGDGLTYSLEAGAPEGAAVNPTNGVFSWIPAEEQGPGTNTITVRVTDDGLPSLNDTKSFMVTVLETNSAPVLSAIGDRVVGAGTTLWVTNVVMDTDIPVNGLTYSLEPGAPATATINATNGLLSWTPGLGEVDTTNAVTVRVTDDGVPALSDTNRFVVRVVSELLVIGGLEQSNGVVRVEWSAVSGHVYRLQYRVDLWGETNWTDAGGEVVAAGTNAWQTNVVNDAVGNDWRFYRVFLVP